MLTPPHPALPQKERLGGEGENNSPALPPHYAHRTSHFLWERVKNSDGYNDFCKPPYLDFSAASMAIRAAEKLEPMLDAVVAN